jgi:hypothetical protein
MHHGEGAPPGVSYRQVVANESHAAGMKIPTFEVPPHIHPQHFVEGTFKDRDMEIDPAKEKISASASAPWMPGKCTQQVPQAPKYVISSPRIEE